MKKKNQNTRMLIYLNTNVRKEQSIMHQKLVGEVILILQMFAWSTFAYELNIQ